jgi:uncharacterized protein
MRVIAELQRIIACDARVDLAALFGSQARGCAGQHSDVDVAVRLASGVPCTAFQEFETSVSRALNRMVEIIDLALAPPLLRFEIARDGQLIVERNAGDWVAFRAQAMIDWWDWQPVARHMAHVVCEKLRTEAQNGQR